jgi:hypothetical protein
MLHDTGHALLHARRAVPVAEAAAGIVAAAPIADANRTHRA